MYSGWFLSLSLFVPTSNTIGNTLPGWNPPAITYKSNFPIAIPIPLAPRSPKPKILDPSVITIASTSLECQFYFILKIYYKLVLILLLILLLWIYSNHDSHFVFVFGGEEHSSGSSEDLRVVVAGPSYGRGVDDGGHFFVVGI